MQIKTKTGIITFEEVHFEQGSGKKINLEISKLNLLSLQKVLDFHKIKFGLIFGTLLGAIRENNFIKHDEDIDIYVLEEDKEVFLNSLHDLQQEGFVVGRYENNLLSIIKDGEYIDIYFFKKRNFIYRICVGVVIKEAYLQNTIEYDFIGSSFTIPKDYENLLVDLYGKDWKTPKLNVPAKSPKLLDGYIIKVKNKFPSIYKILQKIKHIILKK